MNTDPVVATRPRNRKQLIVDAAGRAFNDRGYHAASMEEIAASVGITAAALYRHFPNKYALFAASTSVMVDRLVDAVDACEEGAGLDELLASVAEVTVAHRASGGTYRWEARYLERDDRRSLAAKFDHLVRVVTAAVEREHPGAEPRLRASAALGAIGSIAMHHTSIAGRRAEDVLRATALRVAGADPESRASSDAAIAVPPPPVPRTRRAQILAAAIPLFERDGFANVTLSHIGDVVGLAPSAIYRHYPGKVDILAAACLQAAGLLAQSVEQAVASGPTPRQRLVALAASYVAYSFEHRALTAVAEAEVVGLPDSLRRPVVVAQRDHIAVWEEQLLALRPDLDQRQARVLVHAGFGVVVEAGRALRWKDTPTNRDAVAALLVAALDLT